MDQRSDVVVPVIMKCEGFFSVPRANHSARFTSSRVVCKVPKYDYRCLCQREYSLSLARFHPKMW